MQRTPTAAATASRSDDGWGTPQIISNKWGSPATNPTPVLSPAAGNKWLPPQEVEPDASWSSASLPGKTGWASQNPGAGQAPAPATFNAYQKQADLSNGRPAAENGQSGELFDASLRSILWDHAL